MAHEETIRVVVVDDHDMVRRGLAAYFRTFPDISLIGEAGDGTEAIELCKELHPDVVLMDLIMPNMGGTEATRLIREENPATQVIALTSFQDKDLVQEAFQAGAISYLLKKVKGDDLAAAIRSAHFGRSTVSPEITQDLLASNQDEEPGNNLTRREREVLMLMVEGLTNPDIAERLSISRATVTTHVSHILQKLGVVNRAEAIVMAVRKNLDHL
ncbi:MAG: response regulator transcription factor [Chloroflexota bacterium]|nr:MAG: response regulator transcription factor [Chloroflexota bacterium]